MRSWIVVPFLAVALLSGAVCARAHAADDIIHRGAAQSGAIRASGRQSPGRTVAGPTPDPTVTVTPTPTSSVAAPAGAPMPMLTQVGPGRWETTVLLSETSTACQGSVVYSLKTTSPSGQFPEYSSAPPITKAAPASAPGSLCQVTVIFTGLQQFPATAALILGQGELSSAIQLTVSRNVTLFYYLGIPSAVGGGMVLLFLFSMFFIRIYDFDGNRLRPVERRFWRRPISASGAWTANDSWATNVTAVITVIAAVLAGITATNSLFPGVAIDRFAVANLVAGAIVVAAPLVFGIYYAIWTGRHPGVTAEATLTLPIAAQVAAEPPGGARARLPEGGRIYPPPWSDIMAPPPVSTLPENTDVVLQPGTEVLLPGNGNAGFALPPDTEVTLPPDTEVTLPARAEVTLRDSHGQPVHLLLRSEARAQLPAGAQVSLPMGTSVMLPDAAPRRRILPQNSPEVTPLLPQNPREVTLLLPQNSREVTLQDTTEVRLPGGEVGSLATGVTLRLDAPTGATLRVLTALVPPGDTQIRLPDKTRATVSGDQVEIKAKAGTRATVGPEARVTLDDDPPAAIKVESGANIMLLGAAAVSPPDGGLQEPITVRVGQTIQVPPGSVIRVLAGGAIALPGDANIGVQPGSTLVIDGSAHAITIPADAIWPPAPDDKKAADLAIRCPARITTPGGAKVSLVGAADVTLPQNTVIEAPRRKSYTLRQDRRLVVPQGNVIVATVAMFLTAGAVTMFGIGAELGIVGVLAYGLSDATQPWRIIMLLATTAVALLMLWYAKTATSALADPQPGSSISSTSGTSFTL